MGIRRRNRLLNIGIGLSRHHKRSRDRSGNKRAWIYDKHG